MKKYFNENDPERIIFRGALNSLELEPSDKFWNTALQGIIDKERAVVKKRNRRWRAVAFSLGGIVLLFCVHEAWVYSKMDGIQKEVSELKETQKQLLQKINNPQVADNSITQQPTQQASTTVKETTPSQSAVAVSPVHNTITSQENKQYSAPVHQYANRGSVVNPSQKNIAMAYSQASAQSNTTHTGFVTPALTESVSTENTVPIAANSVNKETVQNNSNSVTEADGQSASALDTKQTTSDSAATLSKLGSDSANSLPAEVANAERKNNFKQRLSFSAFFTPGMANDFMKCKDNDYDNDLDKVTPQDLKNHQSKWFAYQTGIKAGVDLSSKFKLATGIYYNRYSYNISETMLTAERGNDGEVGCSLVTSSGVVHVPYDATPLNPGDSLKVHGSSTREYISIPLQFFWEFASRYKVGFYVVGGFTANIAARATTTLHWENTSFQEGNVTVQNIEGLNAVHFSYSLGAGAEYKLGKGFSAYGEPLVQGSVTPINKNTPVSTFPFFFGCEFGVTYHL